MSRQFFWSPIKRSHLASVLGPASLVRVKSGATALVGGLSEWESHIPGLRNLSPLNREIEKDRFLKQFKLRDPELESVLQVDYFVTNQPLPSEPDRARDWFIPVIRFPLAGVCSNNSCRLLQVSEPDHAGNSWCESCSTVKRGKRFRKKVLQIPFFFICAAGHIEELDWNTMVHKDCKHNCDSSTIKVTSGINMQQINAKCNECACAFSESDIRLNCSGQQPWLKGNPQVSCTLPLARVDRTNVLVYQPIIKSSILMPPKEELNYALVDWLRHRDGFRDFDPDSPKNWQGLMNTVRKLNFNVTEVELRNHVQHVLNEKDTQVNRSLNEDWRTREFEVMTSDEPLTPKWGQKILDHEVQDLGGLDRNFFGPNGLFLSVSKVNMLTETRVLAGFQRNASTNSELSEMKAQLWGNNSNLNKWLPAYRGYGEGILFQVNPDRVKEWNANSGEDRELSRFKLSHTLAHLLIGEAALTSGYSVASIRDRVYSLPDGRLGFLIYTADSDQAGTLGGLVELANTHNLQFLVGSALQSGRWCTQDPVCMNGSGNFQIDLQAGACHQCVLLPETSCEVFNKNLDRGLIFGCAERSLTGILAHSG